MIKRRAPRLSEMDSEGTSPQLASRLTPNAGLRRVGEHWGNFNPVQEDHGPRESRGVEGQPGCDELAVPAGSLPRNAAP
jgi:hypothetical protein